jgi:hypothetical protein
VVAVGLALLLGLAVYVGLYWQLRSTTAYLTAVAATLALWGTAYGLRRSYAGALPGFLGITASLLVGLIGGRAAWRARTVTDGSQWLWFLGAVLAVAPLMVVLFLWLRHLLTHVT